jgi:Insertion element 4 transposase N-terminal
MPLLRWYAFSASIPKQNNPDSGTSSEGRYIGLYGCPDACVNRHDRVQRGGEKALTMVAIVYLVIALTLFPRLTVGGVLRRLANGARFLWPDPREAVATDGAICQRRQRLGVTVLRQLFRRCCHPLATPTTKGAFYRGRRVVAIDGTCEDVADDAHNANYFGRINSGPMQSPFPQLRGLHLVECATHAIFDAVAAPCWVAEARLAPLLLRSITAEMLVLLDRGLFAGPLLEAMRASGAHVVAGLESHILTHPATRLSESSYLAWLSPQASHGLHRPLLLPTNCATRLLKSYTLIS